jgi:hypothetical protein
MPKLLIFIAIAALALGCEPGMKTAPAPREAASPAAPSRPSLPFALGAVSLEVAEGPLPADAPTAAQVEGWLREALLRHPELSAAPPAGAARLVVKGQYRSSWSDARDGSGQRLGAVFLEVSAAVEGRRGEEPYVASAFVGEALTGPDPAAALRGLVQGVTGEVAEALVVQPRARLAEDARLLTLLDKGAGAAALKEAIPEARRRKLRAAAPALIGLLQHDERDVVNLAASALGELGDRGAVPALIEAGSRVAALDRLPVIFALGEIGGPEAALYLETLQSAALEPALKEALARALERARRAPGEGP